MYSYGETATLSTSNFSWIRSSWRQPPRMAAEFQALTASAPSKVTPEPTVPFHLEKNLKVILHGEHAVVYGMTAVGASLDLRTSITIKPHPSKVSLSQWLSPWHLPVTIVHHFQKQNQLSICQVVVHFPDLGLSDSWTIVQLKELFRCFWKFLTWSQSKSWMNLFQALPKIPEQCVPRLSEPSSWFPWSRPVQS